MVSAPRARAPGRAAKFAANSARHLPRQPHKSSRRGFRGPDMEVPSPHCGRRSPWLAESVGIQPLGREL
eukprot:77555-Alexandrium_andersonii.AAC.1